MGTAEIHDKCSTRALPTPRNPKHTRWHLDGAQQHGSAITLSSSGASMRPQYPTVFTSESAHRRLCVIMALTAVQPDAPNVTPGKHSYASTMDGPSGVGATEVSTPPYCRHRESDMQNKPGGKHSRGEAMKGYKSNPMTPLQLL